MRIPILLCIVALAGCASAGAGTDGDRTGTSIVSLGSGEELRPRTVYVRAGTVRLRHWIPSGARLRERCEAPVSPAEDRSFLQALGEGSVGFSRRLMTMVRTVVLAGGAR